MPPEEKHLNNNNVEPEIPSSDSISCCSLQPIEDRKRWEDSPITGMERVQTDIFTSSKAASMAVAQVIADTIRRKQVANETCVLGLATGSTPLTVYGALIEMHQKDGLSFQNVVTFNLDEYYPMQPDSVHSYRRFMQENLFDHIDIIPSNTHVPDGTTPPEAVASHCAAYDKMIQDHGGIDIQILGIGRTGHIGFNEPGAKLDSPTGMVNLHPTTRVDAASDFFALESVPYKALTMGIGTILQSARRILLMAWGEGKAAIVKRAVEGAEDPNIPATFLQHHHNTTFILDEASSASLSRVQAPWWVASRSGHDIVEEWTDELTKKAVIWLALHTGKPIHKLVDMDYAKYGMGALVASEKASAVNNRVFAALQSIITEFPGGSTMTDVPERPLPVTKRVLIFSPHPDDDVISMGGTFAKLVEQKHEVYVAYQTSGSIAVSDEDAIRFADFFTHQIESLEYCNCSETHSLYQRVKTSILAKKPGECDGSEVLEIKATIRKTEARAAARFVGVPDDRMHFLELPFYETGKVKKKPLGEEDVAIVMDIIRKVRPHQIFAAGDLSDPHGTHRVCLEAVFRACKMLKANEEELMKDCWLWLYRGAWQEYPVDEMHMAVPLSPTEVIQKRDAIFKHESQKDRALFPGNDPREFWQRAEARNKGTAELFDKLGLPEYEAMEAFQRYDY